MRVLGIIAALGLAACSTSAPSPARGFDDPAVRALLAQPVPEYYADVRLAVQVARSCARYRFDTALDLAVNEHRSKHGRGSLAALSQRAAIDAMTDIHTRAFRAQYGVVPGEGDVCPAADAELARGSALSALLVPIAAQT